MDVTGVAFVCVGNAGRSQMATAFAERERERRGLDVDVVTGSVDPADRVHEDVVEAMAEEGIDVGDREPRRITPEDVEGADYVVTMGCSVDRLLPEDWTGKSRQWDLAHPGGDDVEAVRRQRDVRGRVDRLERATGPARARVRRRCTRSTGPRSRRGPPRRTPRS